MAPGINNADALGTLNLCNALVLHRIMTYSVGKLRYLMNLHLAAE